jgi:hypothetical protein
MQMFVLAYGWSWCFSFLFFLKPPEDEVKSFSSHDIVTRYNDSVDINDRFSFHVLNLFLLCLNSIGHWLCHSLSNVYSRDM